MNQVESSPQQIKKPDIFQRFMNFYKTITLVDSVILMLIGIMLFFIGYHAMDTGSNLRWLNSMIYVISNYTINNAIAETSIGGIRFSAVNVYVLGIFLMLAGFYLTVSGAYTFGRNYERLKKYEEM